MTAAPVAGIRHVIVDRDGVLNRERSGSPVRSPAEWEWEPGAVQGLRELHAAGHELSIATNQAAVGRGVLAAEDLDALHAWLVDELACLGVPVLGVHVCPHAPDAGCVCRKPATGLVVAALAESGVDPSQALVVGDDLRDIEAGAAAGTGVALVRTGKGATSALARPDVPCFDDLCGVARWLSSPGVSTGGAR